MSQEERVLVVVADQDAQDTSCVSAFLELEPYALSPASSWDDCWYSSTPNVKDPFSRGLSTLVQ